jgi:hypothetical protein
VLARVRLGSIVRSSSFLAGALALSTAACAASAGGADDPAGRPLDSATAGAGDGAAGAPDAEPEPRAPVATFTPPSPRGCSAAGAYDFCFAFDTGTPLAVHVTLPRVAREGDVCVVHFQRVVEGVPKRNLDEVKFRLPATKQELDLYFQVDPAAYRIGFGADADGDGAPEGPGDDVGWSPIVDVGAEPMATAFAIP